MRLLLIACVFLVSELGWATTAPPWDALRQGGVVLLLRHAQTTPGVGDPPGFRLDDCSTQRQLSAQGRRQAAAIAAQLAAQRVQIDQVLSSAWCRCLDTAALAFPGHKVERLPALNSFFDAATQEAEQSAALRKALQAIRGPGVSVWVSHQVNITALTGEYPAQGEGMLITSDGKGGVRLIGKIPAPTP